MIKRTVALLSLFVMLFQSVNFTVSAGNEVADKIKQQAMDMAISFGAVEKDKFECPDTSVSRKDFAKIICNLYSFTLNSEKQWFDDFFGEDYNEAYPQILSATESRFDDVDDGDTYVSYIEYVNSRQLMIGVSDTEFKPEDDITQIQIVKVFLNMMNYEQLAQMKGGYPNGYLEIADELSLFKNIGYSPDKVVSYSDVALMLYNIYDKSIAKYDYDGNVLLYKESDTETFLSYILNMYWTQGMMTKSNYSTMSEAFLEKQHEIIVGDLSFVYEGIEINKNLGRNVRLYYRDKDDREVVYACLSGKDEVIVINAENIESYENNTITYFKGNSVVSKRFEPGAYVILNGSAVSSYDKDLFNFETGEVILVKSGNSGGYDVVIVNQYRNRYVNSVSDDTIYLKSTGEFSEENNVIDMEKTDFFNITDVSGNEMSASDIKAGMVLTFAKGILSASVYISTDYVEDYIITGVDNENRTIAGKDGSFEVCEDYWEANGVDKLYINKSYKIYKNVYGEAVYWEASKTNNNLNFAYLYKTILDTDEGEEKLLLSVFTDDGKHKRLVCAENFSLVNTMGEEIIKCTADGAYVTISEYEGIIRYILDSEGLVKRILLAQYSKDATVPKEGALYSVSNVVQSANAMNINWNTYYKSFITGSTKFFYTDNNTKFMRVPEETSDKNKFIYASTLNGMNTGLSTSTTGSFKMKGYTTNLDTLFLDYVVRITSEIKSDKATIMQKPFIVKNIEMTINDDDVSVYKLNCVNAVDGSDIEFFAESEIIDNVTDIMESTDNEKVKNYKVEDGDIILCQYNSINDNNIVQMYMLYKNDYISPYAQNGEKGWLCGTIPQMDSNSEYVNPISFSGNSRLKGNSALSYTSGSKIIFGTVLNFGNNILKLTTKDLRNGEYTGDTSLYPEEYYMLGTAIVVDYTNKNVVVRTYEEGDIKSYNDYGRTASSVIIYPRQNALSGTIILKR